MGTTTFYVSPSGDDARDGITPGTSVATVEAALRSRRSLGLSEARIEIASGEYALSEPIRLGPSDGNLLIESDGAGTPVFSGGVEIEGWEIVESNGRVAWTADVSGLLAEIGPWRSLFVEGARRPRPRLPKAGHFWIESAPGSDPQNVVLFGNENRFVSAPGDFQPWRNLEDVDVVVSHFWIDSRLPVASFDPETRLLTSSRHAVFTLVDSWSGRYAKYHLENVAEALTEPGEWYLDRALGTLTYLPLPGEIPETTRVVVPRLRQLLRIVGEEGRPVENVTVRGLAFEHADWSQPEGYGVFYDPETPREGWTQRDSFDHLRIQTPDWAEHEWGNSPQAALHVPGALHLAHARGCALEGCTVRHVGWYGVSLYEGCQSDRVERCHLHDLGAGGIVADGASSPPHRRTEGNAFVDNRIESAGHVWPSACGIVTAHSAGNQIAHNEICDVTYTGVSVGWVWGFGENVSRDNRIEANHIHHLALRAGLSDLGGIYTLGVQPGTVVRGNHVHHVESAVYGGQGIYLDEGSSLILVEGNHVHHCSTHAFCEHFGRGNVVRNNVFALCGGGSTKLPDGSSAGSLAMFSRLEGEQRSLAWPPRITKVEANLWLAEGVPIILDEMALLDDSHVEFEGNRYGDVRSSPVLLRCRLWERFKRPDRSAAYDLGFAEWQSRGMDMGGRVEDSGPMPPPPDAGPRSRVGAFGEAR